jgi:hypothetical protein
VGGEGKQKAQDPHRIAKRQLKKEV